ncbi:MAG: proton-conducting transporter membrane subunit, partial [Cytophagales bacterium]
MLTVILLLFPLVSAVVLSLLRGSTVKRVALFISLGQFLYSVYLYSVFCNTCPASKELTYFSVDWILALKSTFTVGLDGISIWLVMLTTFLTPIIILSSFKHNYEKPNYLYSLVFLMQLGMLGVFVAYDCFLFYVFWELALIPIYFISAIYGGAERIKVTLKFFVYTLFGSLLMLVAVIFLYTKSNAESVFLHSA